MAVFLSQGWIQDILIGRGGGGGLIPIHHQTTRQFILSCPTFVPKHDDLESAKWRLYHCKLLKATKRKQIEANRNTLLTGSAKSEDAVIRLGCSGAAPPDKFLTNYTSRVNGSAFTWLAISRTSILFGNHVFPFVFPSVNFFLGGLS